MDTAKPDIVNTIWNGRFLIISYFSNGNTAIFSCEEHDLFAYVANGLTYNNAKDNPIHLLRIQVYQTDKSFTLSLQHDITVK